MTNEADFFMSLANGTYKSDSKKEVTESTSVASEKVDISKIEVPKNVVNSAIKNITEVDHYEKKQEEQSIFEEKQRINNKKLISRITEVAKSLHGLTKEVALIVQEMTTCGSIGVNTADPTNKKKVKKKLLKKKNVHYKDNSRN